ncbi:MAG: sulfatase-like hydrolase/transferase, partial [Myxococcota bacterium]
HGAGGGSMRWLVLGSTACSTGVIADLPGVDPDPDPDPGASTFAVAPIAPTRLAPVPPNVLLVVLDDVGVDQYRQWGAFGADPAAYPQSPSFDGLVDVGLRFDEAYAMPLCSASRATLQTGRYPYRHGVGYSLELDDRAGLPDAEVTLAEVLDGAPIPWSTAWLGKWHLSIGTDGWDAPLAQGFDDYAGSIGNLYAKFTSDGSSQSYRHWEKDVAGELTWVDTYATRDTVNDALDRIATLEPPWLLGVALNTAHNPYALPPDGTWSGVLLGDDPAHRNYHAMIEDADHALGRLLTHVSLEDTVVIVIGDNGTPSEIATGWERPARMKGSPYETGVRVPLVVAGPGVATGVVRAPVSIADLFPTIAAIADAPLPAAPIDGVDLGPYFADPDHGPVHDTVYAETFKPVGLDVPHSHHRRVLRDLDYALVQTLGSPDELYRIDGVVGEGHDLLVGPRDEEIAAAYDRLLAAMPTPLD